MTVAVIARPDKAAADGTAPLWLRITHNRLRRHHALGLRVKLSQWDADRQQMRGRSETAARLNAHLDQVKAYARDEHLRLKTEGRLVTADAVRDAVAERLTPSDEEVEGSERSRDFLRYMDEHADTYDRKGQVHTAKKLRVAVKKLRVFLVAEGAARSAEKARLDFAALTPAVLRRFEAFLLDPSGDYGNSRNTVASDIKKIRTSLYQAIRDGLLTQERNPFFQFTVRETKVEREKLSADELDRIRRLSDLSPGVSKARDYFLFSLYLAGVRFSDVCQLKPEHVVGEDGQRRLVYRMGKTDEAKSLLLVPPAAAIVDRYLGRDRTTRSGREAPWLFPILDDEDVSTPKKLMRAVGRKNSLVNKQLKTVAKRAGTKSFSFHMARHSFADLARQKGWSIYDVSKALGHSSIEVTQRYLAGFDRGGLDEKMKDLF